MVTGVLSKRGRISGVMVWFLTLGHALQLYVVGTLIFSLAAAAARLGVPREGVSALLLGAGFCLATAFVLEAYAAGLKLWDTRPGKLAGALVATLVGAIAMGLASVCVNQATGLDPSHFPYAIAFLAPWTAGYILLIGTVAISMLAMLIFAAHSVLLWVPALTAKRVAEKQHFVNWVLFRMFGWIALILMTSTTWERGHQGYDGALMNVAGWFVYSLEMYGQDSCARKGERVRRIDDQLVAIGTIRNGRLAVELRSCSLEPGPTTSSHERLP